MQKGIEIKARSNIDLKVHRGICVKTYMSNEINKQMSI